MENNSEKQKSNLEQISKFFRSSDYFLQFESMKEELLVIANNISCGEMVSDFRTHRPSSSAGERHLKQITLVNIYNLI